MVPPPIPFHTSNPFLITNEELAEVEAVIEAEHRQEQLLENE